MKADESCLKRVLADVLGVEMGLITDDASVDTIKEWDSLHHLNLVLALESEFNVSLSEEETVQILSYPLIKAVLGEHDVRFTLGDA